MKRLLLLFALAVSAVAQAPPIPINPGSPVASAVVNANFLGLYNGRVGRWSGNGVPGDINFTLVGDEYFDLSHPGNLYGCYRVHCTAVASNNWVLVSTGATVATTSSALKGDGAGNAIAITGTGSNCVLVNGGSATCGGTAAGSTNDFQVNVGGVFTGGRGSLDSSGNAIFPGTVTSGSACSGCAGSDDMIAGTPAAVPSNSFGWGARATFTTSLRLIPCADAAPTASQFMLFGAPSSNVSCFTWTSILPAAQGGTGGNSGSSTGMAKVLAGTWSYIDLPEALVIPAANCVGGTAGVGWSNATSNFTAACRAGSNNLGGALQAIPSTGASAQFLLELPLDWDTAAQPFINVFYGSGANTSGTVIWTVSSACSKADGSVTDDPAFHAETAFASQTMATANRTWSKSGQYTAITSANNCIPGGTVIVKVALSGTAGSNINAYQAVLTIPRLPAVQAE